MVYLIDYLDKRKTVTGNCGKIRKFQKLRLLIIKTLSTSEGISESQTEQLSESETQVEEISSTESVESSDSTVTDEAVSDGDLSVDNQASSEITYVSESEESQVAVITTLMSWLITMLRRLAAAAGKGETVKFEAVQTRKVEENLKKFSFKKLKQNNIATVPSRRRVLFAVLA